jgi:hypothetical protein
VFQKVRCRCKHKRKFTRSASYTSAGTGEKRKTSVLARLRNQYTRAKLTVASVNADPQTTIATAAGWPTIASKCFQPCVAPFSTTTVEAFTDATDEDEDEE